MPLPGVFHFQYGGAKGAKAAKAAKGLLIFRFDCVPNDLTGPPDALAICMGVHSECDGGITMAQAFTDGDYISSADDRKAGRRVAQLVGVTYQPAVVAELMRETRDAMDELVHGERDKLADDLDNILDAKRQQYKAIGLAAPTTEQINLLTALNLRDSVSEAKVSHIAAEMAGNFQALRALKSIAKRSGIDFPDPPSVENVEEDLNLAREYATSSLRDIAVPNDELGYFSRCFYIAPGVGPARKFLDLDNNIFTAVQAQQTAQEDTNERSER